MPEPHSLSKKFITIARAGESEVTEKKSRFLGRAFSVSDETIAQQRLAELKLQESDASHHAWAFSIGTGTPLLRFSDAGEPSGTAGRPLLHLLEKRELRNVLLIVTRWYGGTKLGTGGLARAYGAAGAAALDSSGTTRMSEGSLLEIIVDYPEAAQTEHRLKERGVRVDATIWLERVTINCWFDGEIASISGEIADLTSGRGSVQVTGREYRPAPIVD